MSPRLGERAAVPRALSYQDLTVVAAIRQHNFYVIYLTTTFVPHSLTDFQNRQIPVRPKLVPTHSLHGATSSLQLRSHRAGFSDAKPLTTMPISFSTPPAKDR